jgi:acyl-CoA reductase-like NAD-dependent aldehyde dehydrogenase
MEKALIIDKNPEFNERFTVRNPYDGSGVDDVFYGSEDQTNRAIDSSLRAFKTFRFTKPEDRREMLLQLSEFVHREKKRLSELMCRESGKPIKNCDSEIHASVERLNIAASEVFFSKGETMNTRTVTATVFREPLGVISVIGPFNYPFFSMISKLAPAIAVGNTVVGKPASDDPLSFMDFAWGAQQILPAGVLNALTGSGRVVGNTLVKNPKTKMIAFTGSYDVGSWIAKNAGMKVLQLELGGKAPAIVLPDADLVNAAKEIVKGSLTMSGQRCDAISAVAVHSEVKAELTELIVKEASKWKVGDPLKETTDMGPMINSDAVKKVKGMVDEAIAKGAVPLTDYKIQGNMLYPVVLDKVNEGMRVCYEETFGPVIPILQFKDIDWLIGFFSSLPYRLDSSIFSESARKIFYIVRRLGEGSIHINGAPFHGLGVFPYGEDPGAGMGREGLPRTMEEMTSLKTVAWNM